jgi:hypothetical protein
MANMQEVIAGLKEGKAYIRRFGIGDFAGHETVQPTSEGFFEHTFAGHNYGGVAEMSINVLENGRWNKDGWSQL